MTKRYDGNMQMKKKCAHGTLEALSVNAVRKDGGVHTVSYCLTYRADEECRIPLTFSILGKATTKLCSFKKGLNDISSSLDFKDAKASNPIAFMGGDSAEALVRIDGLSIPVDVDFP